MKTQYIFLILIILSIPNVNAITGGDDYLLTNISYCEGEYQIKARAFDSGHPEDINFQNCVGNINKSWFCFCGENIPVMIQTKNTTDNTYDITVQYYLQLYKEEKTPEDSSYNHNNRRVLQFNDIKIKPKKQVFSFPTISKASGMGIISFVGIIFIAIVYGLYRLFKGFFDKEDVKITPKIDKYKDKKEPKDDAIDQFIKNI